MCFGDHAINYTNNEAVIWDRLSRHLLLIIPDVHTMLANGQVSQQKIVDSYKLQSSEFNRASLILVQFQTTLP